jgi:hypothetical protein
MRSDPNCTSLDCETRHMNPSKEEKNPVLYDFNKPLDEDVISTTKHLADQEKIHGKWNGPEEDVQLRSSLY